MRENYDELELLMSLRHPSRHEYYTFVIYRKIIIIYSRRVNKNILFVNYVVILYIACRRQEEINQADVQTTV
jgi:hypothetical protein